ncbi:MAG: acyl carrier protein [Gammaproteobacteria bacterium]|nr:acyl carrier protein [Gammaproteobacteria bacterium]
MENEQQILIELRKILVELFEVNADDVTMDALLFDELDIDSIDAVDLIVRLKELTGKKISPEDFKSVRSVGDIVNAVKKVMAVQ